MARGHQADLMELGQVALRRNRVTWMQLSSIDAPANGALNPLVRRLSVAVLNWHSLPRTGPGLLCRHLGGNRTHNKNDIPFHPCVKARALRAFVTGFFFSSRRRHTRLTCDWSSDVCSSD